MVGFIEAGGRGVGRRTRIALSGCVAVLGLLAAAPQPARAQFFWDQPRLSPDDAARAVIERGFRPLHRPFRNDNVYVADVVDPRGRRERLIVSADSGQIVQRFFLGGPRVARGDDEDAPIPPGRIPNTDGGDHQPNLFSRLFGGGNDDTPQPEDAPQFGRPHPLPAPEPAVRPRVKRVPKMVERTPETVRPDSPIESAPLKPVQPATAPAPTAPTGTASLNPNPQPAAVAPAAPTAPDKPGRAISHDPLAIPGSREEDEKNHPKATAANASAPATKPVPDKPKDAGPAAPPAAKSVPVAPLD